MDLQEQLVMAGINSRGFLDDLPEEQESAPEPLWVKRRMLATRHAEVVDETIETLDGARPLKNGQHPWATWRRLTDEVLHRMAMEDLLDVRSIQG